VHIEPINPMDELMEQFVSDYPTSVKQNRRIEVAHFHFNGELSASTTMV
jgi:hypothetical protein